MQSAGQGVEGGGNGRGIRVLADAASGLQSPQGVAGLRLLLCSPVQSKALPCPRLRLLLWFDSGQPSMLTNNGAARAAAAPAPPPLRCAAGKYELTGVLTHKGRSADSGHYVSWVKQHDGSWVLFDDDELIMKKDEDVLALCGGGDWHMAYLLLYRAVKVPEGAEAAPAPAAAEQPAA